MADQESKDLVRLLIWLSPAFPVGGFSYSHGLEWMVRTGRIGGPPELADWLTDLLRLGSGWSDAVIFAEAWRAVSAGDGKRLAAAAELAEALAPSAERLTETIEQGSAFLRAAAAWSFPLVPAQAGTQSQNRGAADGALPAPKQDEFGSSCRSTPPARSRAGGNPVGLVNIPGSPLSRGRAGEPTSIHHALGERAPYPVAVAAVCAAHGIGCGAALGAYLQGFIANQISAAVRLIPMGQSDGLAVLARLEPQVLRTAARAAASSIEDLGSATVLADIASMRHENHEARLFRS